MLKIIYLCPHLIILRDSHNLFNFQSHFIFFVLKTFFFLGDITQKGYEKKRQRLLAPYMSVIAANNNGNGSVAGQGQSQGK